MEINSVLLLRVSSVVDKDVNHPHSTILWMARMRVNELDYEMLSQMKRAGCIMLGIRVESGFYRRYLFRTGFAVNHMRKHARFYRHNPDVFWSLLEIRKIL